MISHKLRDRENYGNVDERGKNQICKVKFPEKNIPSPPPPQKKQNSAAEKLIRKAGHWYCSSSAVKIRKP